MAAEEEIMKIRLDADLSGGVATEKQYDRLIAKAKELGKQGTASGKQVESSLGGVRRAAGLLRGALTGFGIAGAIMGLVSAFKTLKDSFGDAKKEADELAAAKSKAEQKEAVEALAKSYTTLAESAKNAAAALQHNNEMLDISVKNARDLEDAQLNLAEQKELAAIDDSDPAAGEKRAQISARYAQRRGALAASRGKEDVVYQRQKLQEEADLKRSQAAGIEAATAETDALIAQKQALSNEAGRRAVVENREDATGFWSMFGKYIKDVATLNWGKVGDTHTAEGDAKRKEAADEQEALNAEIKQLQEQKAAKLKEAENLRKEAERAEEKKNALGGQIEVADVRRQAADVSGRASVVAADTAREKKEAQIAKDEKTVAEGRDKVAQLESVQEFEEARAAAAANAYAKEQGDVIAAQGRYDMLVANGGSRKERSAALAALQKEQAEADEAKYEMERVAAQVAGTVKAIKEQISALSRAMKQAETRLGANQADSPEG